MVAKDKKYEWGLEDSPECFVVSLRGRGQIDPNMANIQLRTEEALLFGDGADRVMLRGKEYKLVCKEGNILTYEQVLYLDEEGSEFLVLDEEPEN